MSMTVEQLRQFADDKLGLRFPYGTLKQTILQRIVNAAVAARDITWQ